MTVFCVQTEAGSSQQHAADFSVGFSTKKTKHNSKNTGTMCKMSD